MATKNPTSPSRSRRPTQSADSARSNPSGVTDFLARLARAAGDVDDNHDQLKAAIELRDQLVIEAHDSHAMTTTEIARAAGLSQSRVVQILAAH